MNGLLAHAIEAHGGLERWKQFTGIEVDLVSSGELLDRKIAARIVHPPSV
jgi:hypothetical protein